MFGGSVALAMMLGCSSDKYLYSPAEQATATMDGLPAGRYAIPPEQPLGTVVIASPGVVELKFSDGVKTRMLSVRMTVTNNSDDVPWKIDTREARIVLPGGGESAPAYVNTDGQELPVVEVARGHKRALDLYYPLPAEAKDEKHVPEFDFKWQVHTSNRTVAERTPFDRLELEPAYAAPNYAWGFAPYWWYDPFWPGATYAYGPPYVYRHPRPAKVAPVPLAPPPKGAAPRPAPAPK